MRPFSPTLGAIDTGKNVRDFVKDNTEILWRIAKPLVIWIVGLTLLDTIITIAYFPDSESGFGLFGILSGYFYTCIAISWHRVVIHGPDRFIPMNPFKPKKHEWVFLCMGLLLGFLGFVIVIPMIVYFYPIMYALVITVLSNYYQHALQNKDVPSSDQS